MEPQFAYAPTRGGGHGDTDAEEMQHMWQFLDAALPTPPTAAHAPPPVAAASAPMSAAMGAMPMPPGEPDEALNDDENGMYNELGDVFNNLLFFGMDDAQHPAQLLHGASPPGVANVNMNPAHAAHVKYSEQGGNTNIVDVAGPNNSTLLPTAAAVPGGDGANGSQKVQLPRSASVSSSHSGVDSISPVGLLGYPSMSPATINWLQSLATSASSESLTGLISPATLYSGSAGIAPSAVSGSAGGPPSSTGPVDSGKAGNLPRCVTLR